jgi:hypothetical protein
LRAITKAFLLTLVGGQTMVKRLEEQFSSNEGQEETGGGEIMAYPGFFDYFSGSVPGTSDLWDLARSLASEQRCAPANHHQHINDACKTLDESARALRDEETSFGQGKKEDRLRAAADKVGQLSFDSSQISHDAVLGAGRHQKLLRDHGGFG